METRIIRVGTLEEFIVEIPSYRDGPYSGHPQILFNGQLVPPIRISLTDKEIIGGGGLTATEYALHLQGVNSMGEIVWLMESHRTVFDVTPFRDAMLVAYDLVKAHLAAAGYEVRGGSFGLPAAVEPVRGRFECLRWRKDETGDANRWIVEPLPPLPLRERAG